VRVLLIQDRKPLNRALRRGLQERGFAVDVAHDGAAAGDKARGAEYDLIVLDLMLPDGNGLSLLRRWRRKGLRAGLFVLAPRGGVEDEVRRLNLSDNNYMTIPFEPEELFARLTLICRMQHAPEQRVRVHDLEIDRGSRTVRRAGRSVRLTPREYDLLELLARHRGRVVSRAVIWSNLYDEYDAGTSNVIDVYIRSLRRKIDRGFDLPLILTRWGEGYQLRADAG
jgi:DNA-binding response OmpR family regulator